MIPHTIEAPFAPGPRPAPVDPAAARRWKPLRRGPREQWLRCEGGLCARIAAALHFAWPFARGQWRYTRLLRALPGHAFEHVPFRSACGVAVKLDLRSEDFLHLSGRLATEPLEVAVMSRLVRDGDLFVDAGAHRGLYVLHVLGRLGPEGRYHAFEPSPTLFRFLQRSFAPLDPRLVLRDAAVSDVEGDAVLEDEGELTARLIGADASGTRVRTARLDAALADVDFARRVLVMKLDTEGCEARVIRGCAGLARRGVRPVILTEFIPDMYGQSRAEVMGAIAETFGAGYRYLAIDGEGGALREFAPGEALPARIRNILAVPEERMDRLEGCMGTERAA
jgi:FkbM family methyltransferase